MEHLQMRVGMIGLSYFMYIITFMIIEVLPIIYFFLSSYNNGGEMYLGYKKLFLG